MRRAIESITTDDCQVVTMTTDHHYEPVTARILKVLREHADDRGVVALSHRQIGILVHCSIGGIPAIMKRLEHDGKIRRDVLRPNRRRIVLLDVPSPAPPIKGLQARQSARQSENDPDLVTLLERLATLHGAGNLSDEEFAAAKRKLLG